MQIQCKLRLEKTTPGTFKYQEFDDAGDPTKTVMGTLYVQKAAVGGKAPETITIEF